MEELDRSVALRTFFARYVAAEGRAGDPRIEQAFRCRRARAFCRPRALVYQYSWIRLHQDAN
jgi:hypothetical protein